MAYGKIHQNDAINPFSHMLHNVYTMYSHLSGSHLRSSTATFEDSNTILAACFCSYSLYSEQY